MRVTLSWAQSLDGCIAARQGEPTGLSGPDALRMTHALRASHDAILVGIGTVLADDPRLTNRLADGPNPQPVVLDSQLRCPVSARLVREAVKPLWLLTTVEAPIERERALLAAGARVFRLPSDSDRRVGIPAALALLETRGIQTLMVEGGARVLTTFLRHRLANRLVVTIAPRFLSGLHAIGQADLSAVKLGNVAYRALGVDVVVEADVA